MFEKTPMENSKQCYIFCSGISIFFYSFDEDKALIDCSERKQM